MLSQINQDGAALRQVVRKATRSKLFRLGSVPTAIQIQKQYEIAAHPAVKIYVRREATWYRVTQPDLVKGRGLDPNVDPALLHLYVEALGAARPDHGRHRRVRRLSGPRGQPSISTARESILFSLVHERIGSSPSRDKARAFGNFLSPPDRTSLRPVTPQPLNCSSTLFTSRRS